MSEYKGKRAVVTGAAAWLGGSWPRRFTTPARS